MKTEALKIADKLGNPDLCSWQKPTKEAVAMIRKLVEELDKRDADISTLSQEHTSMRARMERLEDEIGELNERS